MSKQDLQLALISEIRTKTYLIYDSSPVRYQLIAFDGSLLVYEFGETYFAFIANEIFVSCCGKDFVNKSIGKGLGLLRLTVEEGM